MKNRVIHQVKNRDVKAYLEDNTHNGCTCFHGFGHLEACGLKEIVAKGNTLRKTLEKGDKERKIPFAKIKGESCLYIFHRKQ